MRRRKRATTTIPYKFKNPIKFIFILIASSFLILQLLSLLRLSQSKKTEISSTNLSSQTQIGPFGKSIIQMLPEDLAFTLFLPSEQSFHRLLRLKPNDTDSYAVLTRVMGFSAVPRWIWVSGLDQGKETVYDSITGFRLYVSRSLDGLVVVNGVVAETVDLRMGNLVVHLMDGVVMDSEFEESVRPDDDDDDDGVDGGGEKQDFS